MRGREHTQPPLALQSAKDRISPKRGECLEVDGLQDVLGCVELQEQHDEDAVVGQLLEFCLPDIMVLDQHSNHDTQHLDGPGERVRSWSNSPSEDKSTQPVPCSSQVTLVSKARLFNDLTSVQTIHFNGLISGEGRICLTSASIGNSPYALHLVEEVDLGHCVGGLSRVFDQQGYQPDKGIQVVVTFGSDDGRAGCWVVLLLRLCTVTDLHTHFCAKPEEPRDQIVGLQDPLLVHLQTTDTEVSEAPANVCWQSVMNEC